MANDKDEVIKLAVFGSPIAHSMSPYIHNFFAKQFDMKIDYQRILVDKDFSECINEFFQNGGYACNITMPCKEAAFKLARESSNNAKIAKAANCLQIVKEGSERYLKADSSDGAGFYYDIVRLNCKLEGSSILVLGGGGAARSILTSLLSEKDKVKEIVLATRHTHKAEAYFSELRAFYKEANLEIYPDLSAVDYTKLQSMADNGKTFNTIINATSLSVNKKLPPIDTKLYESAQFAYDLFYTKEGTTVFVDEAKKHGVERSFDGLGMLVGQAAVAFENWFNGKKPDADKTIEYMRDLIKTL